MFILLRTMSRNLARKKSLYLTICYFSEFSGEWVNISRSGAVSLVCVSTFVSGAVCSVLVLRETSLVRQDKNEFDHSVTHNKITKSPPNLQQYFLISEGKEKEEEKAGGGLEEEARRQSL